MRPRILGLAALFAVWPSCAKDSSIDPHELDARPAPDMRRKDAVPAPDRATGVDAPPRVDGAPADTVQTPDLPVGPQTLVAFGAVWSYDDSGTDHGQSWLQSTFDCSSWSKGAAELGYGEGDEQTVLQQTSPARPSAYFLKTLTLPAKPAKADLSLVHDDGVAVWVNGKQVFSKYMDNGTNHSAWASAVSLENEKTSASIDLSLINPFVSGKNVLAAMVKQHSGTSSDLSFDLQLSVSYGK